eukprot:m.214792 g.214792  ORF g.214792 m.214792 type:complete len:112 (+) comp37208_c0_seq1:22-357(+)
MALILGVGVGTFLIFLIWVAVVLICSVFRNIVQAKAVYVLTFLVGGLLSIILIMYPREATSQPQTSAYEKSYDHIAIGRGALTIISCVFLGLGALSLLLFHFAKPVHSKPL